MLDLRWPLFTDGEGLDFLAEIVLWSWVVATWASRSVVARLCEVDRSTWRSAHVDLWGLCLCERLSALWGVISVIILELLWSPLTNGE